MATEGRKKINSKKSKKGSAAAPFLHLKMEKLGSITMENRRKIEEHVNALRRLP